MDVDDTTGLSVANREISQTALHRLFQAEKCTAVKLSDLRLDRAVKQAVGVVIFGRGRSRPAASAKESGTLYFITDLRGNTGSLELFHDAKQKFRGVASSVELEGIVLFLLNPSAIPDPLRPETLLFKVSRQQDMVVVGKCPTFGRCDGVRKDGKACSMPVDIGVSTRCKYHQERTEAQLQRLRTSSSAVTARPAPAPAPVPVASVPVPSKESSAPVDLLKRALKADLGARFVTNHPQRTKSSAVCPQEEGDDDGDVDSDRPSVLLAQLDGDCDRSGRVLAASGEGEKGYLNTLALQAPRTTSNPLGHKDGSVAVPGESRVFKTLSEAHYKKRAGLGDGRAAAQALKTGVGTSSRTIPSTVATAAPENDLLGTRHTGATRHSALVAQSEKRKIDQSVFDKIHKFSKLKGEAGGDLFDLDQARKNANNGNANKKVEASKAAQQAKTSQKQLDMDIAALLSRESSHSAEAEEDAFKVQMKRLDTLSRREYMAQKDEKVHSLTVKASQCLTCNEVSETPLEKCRKQGHSISTVSVLKRFYECSHCDKRESTLGSSVRLPKHACLRCGEYKWRPCGKRKTGMDTSCRIPAGERLVVSMSADTGRYDVDRVVGAKSSLDYQG